jgi:hypothetical protein
MWRRLWWWLAWRCLAFLYPPPPHDRAAGRRWCWWQVELLAALMAGFVVTLMVAGLVWSL